MAVVTPAQYRLRTGDITSPYTLVEELLADATRAVEEATGRLLESVERTETLKVHATSNAWGTSRGRMYPSARPISAVSAATLAAGVTIESTTTLMVGSYYPDMIIEGFTSVPGPRAVTYTGGFTDETLPVSLRYAIIDVASASRTAGGSDYPAGAQSVSLGDASITFRDTDTALSELDALVPGISSRLRPWRNRL